MLHLVPMPLEADAFLPFGDVLTHDPSSARTVNQGRGWRTEIGTDARAPDAAAALALYRLSAQCLPLTVTLFERHPQSAQVFSALTVERFAVVVAPTAEDGLPDGTRARGFLGVRGQTLRYHRNVWHAPMVALDRAGDMLMLAFERGLPEDCIEHHLVTPLLLMA